MASLNLFDEVDIDYDPEIERRTLIILETASVVVSVTFLRIG